MRRKLITELSEKNKTSHVQYADKPLLLGGLAEEITLDALYKKANANFIYSDALFSAKKHPPYRNSKQTQKSIEDKFTKNFKVHDFTSIDSFVICNMGKLGHGVCANQDFEPYECFILYSGIIVEKDSDAPSIGQSDYEIKYQSKINLSVDAAERGNVSRFIQHMPLNHQTFKEITQEMPSYYEETNTSVKSDQFWQYENLVCKEGIDDTQVAWANLFTRLVWIRNKPCIVLFNPRKINAGEQLGFSYGDGYWIFRRQKPELFDLSGNIIPHDKYGYKEAPIYLPTARCFRKLLGSENFGFLMHYNKSMLLDDLKRSHETVGPVWFTHAAEPISIYKLRELLIYYNAIDADYGPVENDFIRNLRNIMPQALRINLFKRFSNDGTSREIFDLVFYTEDLMKWSQLTLWLKSPVLRELPTTLEIKCLKFTQEVILIDIGQELKQQLIQNILEQAIASDFFRKDIPKKFIPNGPERDTTDGFIQPNSTESMKQIQRLTPEIKVQDLKAFYATIGAEFEIRNPIKSLKSEPHITPRKEEYLNEVTHGFFSKQPPAHWKIYPEKMLKGKFIGHEVRFFNFPNSQQVQQANSFLESITAKGFAALLRKSNGKPSIIVDLTESNVSRLPKAETKF